MRDKTRLCGYGFGVFAKERVPSPVPHLIKASLGICAALAVAGCVSPTAPDFDGSAFYQAGYGDGCSTAVEGDKSFSTKLIRNEALYKTDEGYRSGWRQGYAACNENARRDDGDLRGQQDPFL